MYTVYGTVLNNTYFKKHPKDERRRLSAERLLQEAQACLQVVKQLGAWPSAPGEENPDTILHRELRFELLQACGHADSEAVQLVDSIYTGPKKDRSKSRARSKGWVAHLSGARKARGKPESVARLCCQTFEDLEASVKVTANEQT